MKEDRARLRELLEENKMLLEELQKLQTKYVQEKLFPKKENIEDSLEREIELEQKVDILIRYLVTNRIPYDKDKQEMVYNKDEELKVLKEFEINGYTLILNKYEATGIKGVQRYFDSLPISKNAKAKAWKRLSNHLSEKDMQKAASAAWQCWLANPEPEILKWLAFRMYEADEVFFADILFRMLPSEITLNEEEKRKRISLQERLRKRTAYLRGLREMERANISLLRKKVMRLERKQETIKQIEKDKKNLLFMIQLKDSYLEKVNKENLKYKNLLQSIKNQCE